MFHSLRIYSIVCIAILVVLAPLANARPAPVGTAFTYQGLLNQGGDPVNGTADFQFSLFDEAAGGNQVGTTQAHNAITVTNGGFTLDLDFGAGVFGSDARWLQIAVRSPAGSGTFTTLSPRQRIHPVPVAQFALGGAGAFSGDFTGNFSGSGANLTNVNAANIAGTLPSSALSGTYSGAVNFTNAASSFVGTFSGDGAGLGSLNASAISSGTLSESRLSTGLLDRIPTLELSPTQIGTYASIGSLKTIIGSRLYTISSGWSLFDISNPAAPVELGGGPEPGVTRNIAVSGTTVYELHSFGASELLRIYDAANPAAITMVGSAPLAGPAISGDICIRDVHAYIGLGSTLQVFNVTNPAAPVSVGTMSTGTGNISDFGVLNNYLYVLKETANAIQIYDLTNPASPSLAATYNIVDPVYIIIAPDPTGNLAYVTREGPAKIVVLNLANPIAPVQVGSVLLPGSATGPPTRSENYLFEFCFDSGIDDYRLAIVDVSIPQDPQFIGDIDYGPSSPFTAAANSTHLFLNQRSLRLTGLEFNQPLASTMYTDGSQQTTAFLTNYAGTLNFTNASNSFAGMGAGLTNLNASNMTTGTLADGRLGGAYSGTLTFTNATNTFAGNGAGLTSLNAANVSTGSLDAARLPTGGAWSVSSNLNLDSNTLVIDPVNNRVGVGSAAPASKLTVYEPTASLVQTNFTQGLASAGVNIVTDFIAEAYTPGVFWSTQNQNAAKPKAGIYMNESNNGSSLHFGTSNSYTQGITNSAMVLDHDGNLDVGGTITLSTQTRRLSIPGGAFVPNTNTIAYNAGGVNSIRGTTAAQAVGFNAYVHLPDGATITAMVGFIFDNDTTQNMTITLFRATDTAVTSMASVSSTGNSAIVQTPSDVTISSPVVSNTGGGYVVQAGWTVPATPTNIELRRVEIVYTVTSPLP